MSKEAIRIGDFCKVSTTWYGAARIYDSSFRGPMTVDGVKALIKDLTEAVRVAEEIEKKARELENQLQAE